MVSDAMAKIVFLSIPDLARLFPLGKAARRVFFTVKQFFLKLKLDPGEKQFNPGDKKKKDKLIMKSILTLAMAGAFALAVTPAASAADIVDVAVAGNFKTLVAAVKAADMVDVLKGAGPFTVFAPTDEAFAKLPAGTVETLLMPENKAKLQSILKYHVVAGKVMAKDVMKLNSANTVEGSSVSIKTMGGGVMVNNAHVTKADIKASNGVIHAIDTVLMP